MTTLSPADRRAVLRVLKKARVLVKKAWTQGPYSFDRNGNATPPNRQDACSWCATGSLLAITNHPNHYAAFGDKIYEAAFVAMSRKVGLTEFNEQTGRTKAQVLDRFDKTIAHFEASA